jgi:hypothetical protein
MSSTDKGEIMASKFAIALNDFMTEHHGKQGDVHLEEQPPQSTSGI